MVDFSVAIMAGGKSSRMGTDKSFLEVDGKPIIERIISRTADLGQQETLLITNRPHEYAHLGLPMYADVVPDKGSLGGIYTAISHSRTQYVLVVACDMPFVSTPLLRYMLAFLDGDGDGEDGKAYDVIVPRVEGYPQGLHAIYGNACLEPIRARIEADRLKVIGFYNDVRVRYLDEADYRTYDPQNTAFMNINTPEEYQLAQQLALKKANQ